MSERPNVLIFCVDEMRADHMAGDGNELVQTPNLDRLAARGTVFDRAYCSNPICMPARATMFTGLLPRDHGLRVNGQSLRGDLPVLPGILRGAGYRTHAAGKLHLTPWVPRLWPPDPQRCPEAMEYWRSGLLETFPTPYYGFESVDFVGGHTSYVYGPYLRWLEEHGGRREWLTEQAGSSSETGAPQCYRMGMPEELHYNRWIADSTIRAMGESGERPFFIWCSLPDPHAPVAPPAPYCDMYDPADVPAPVRAEGELERLPSVYRRVLEGKLRPNGILNTGVSETQWREMRALTLGMVTHVDAEIGRVLDALDACGQADNTIVLFTSDHGDMMGDHGLLWKAFYTFAGCIRIPLIAAAPGMPGGRRSQALVSQIDLLPSVLDLCGIAQPGARWTESETPFERGEERSLVLRPGRSWRGLLDGSAESIHDSVVIENDDPTTGYQVRTLVTERHRLSIYPGTDEGELFDLDEDPGECRNLWSERPELRERLMRELLMEYSRQTPWYPVPPWNA